MHSFTFSRPRLLLFVGLLLLWLLLTPFPTTSQSTDQPVARIVLFYSPTCPHCIYVLDNVLPDIQAQYGSRVEVQLLDLSVEDHYLIYAALHEQNANLPTGVPQAYIDQYVLVGSDQIEVVLPKLVDACLEKGGCDWPFRTQPEQITNSASAANAQPVYLAYCFDPTCLECDQVTLDLNYLQQQYPNVVVQHFNIRDDAAMIEAMCERYGVADEKRLVAPAIFIGKHYLVREEITASRLKTLIETTAQSETAPPWEGVDVQAATSQITERFGNFSVLAVAAAGLLDGVNPCAFATIIFFISYLALIKREKHELLLVGAAFTLAVFITYLLLGLGLSAILERIGGVATIGRLIYGATAIICLGLAAVSLWDYNKIRKGQLKDIALQLPKALKRRIHDTIRARSRMRGYVAAAFGAGVLVSLFELACTGQVYLPTIVFMTGVAEQRWTAIVYLVLYNLLFVVPLIVVFSVAYFGTSSDRLTAVFQSNAGMVKLLTAVLFSALGLWLSYMVLLG